MLQTTVIDMEWNTKWDWENIDIFCSKGVGSPKKLQSTEWGITAGEDISFKASKFSFEGCGGFNDTCSKKNEFTELNGTSPSLEASVCSSEQSIGLKLGKRTYFENNFTESNTKTHSSPSIPVSTMKKVKVSCQSSSFTRCQVEGCNLNLSSAKEYHRKHKVCENHSKTLKVVVGGLERRFCQQCSRFHGLSEFDGKKRSCRRRLSDHNARRRKPQQEAVQINSRAGQQHLSFVFNNVPVLQTKPPASSIWVSTGDSKHSLPPMKAEKLEGGDGLISDSLGIQFANDVSMPTLAFNKIMPSKITTAGVFYQDSNAEALDIRRALSLLSNGSWGSCEPDFTSLNHPMHTDPPPLSSPEYWRPDHPPPHAAYFPASHVLKASYGIQYGNPMDEI